MRRKKRSRDGALMWGKVLLVVTVMMNAHIIGATTTPGKTLQQATAAEARLVISRAFLAHELQRHVDDTLRVLADIPADVPFVGTVHFRPAAQVQSVDVVVVEHTATVTVDVEGLLLPVDGPLPPINWRGRVRAVVAPRVVRHPDGALEVQFGAVAGLSAAQAMRVDVEVDGLESFAPRVAAMAQQQLLVLQREHGPLGVLVVAPSAAAHVVGARVTARAGACVVELDLDARDAGVVPGDAPIVEAGLGLLLPASTVRGLIAAALQRRSTRFPTGWSVQVTALDLDGRAFTLALRAHHARLGTQALTASGQLVVAEGAMRVQVDRVAQRNTAAPDASVAPIPPSLVDEVTAALTSLGGGPLPLERGRRLHAREVRTTSASTTLLVDVRADAGADLGADLSTGVGAGAIP